MANNTYETGADVLGRGHGGGHGHGGHGGRGRGGRGFWGGWFPGYYGGYDLDDYVIVADTDKCDFRGPDGECYVRADRFLGYDSSVHSATLRDSPVEDQIYALQVAAAKTKSPSLMQAAKDLQAALSSWWSTFSTSGIKEQAASLGKAIAKYTGGPDPLDGPPIKGGVASAEQEQLFDKGVAGKTELAIEDTSSSARERAQEAIDIAKRAKKYTEETAKKANTTIIVVAVATGIVATSVIGTLLYKQFGRK